MSSELEPKTEPGEHRGDPKPDLVLSTRLISAIVVVLLALFVAVVVVGLARDNLNPLGVATVISTMFSGIVVGVLTRKGGGPS